MHRWLSASLICLGVTGCSTVAGDARHASSGFDQSTAAQRELPPLPEHSFGGAAVGFVGRTESLETPAVDESEGLLRVTIPLGTSEPVRCFLYSKPLNLAQTLRMFVNHVAESVERQEVDHIHAGEVDGVPFIAVHTSYVGRADNAGNKAHVPGQLKYMAARGEAGTTVCMHDEVGFNETFERVVKGFVATQKFTDGHRDPAAKLLVWHDVSVASAGMSTVGVVEHRLYEGEAGYAYAASVSMLLPGEQGHVIASDEVDNQFSDTQGGIVEATYIKIMNDSVAYNLGLHFQPGSGYHIDGMHNGAPIDITLPSGSALPDFASQTAALRHLFANRDASAHWVGFSPEEPSKLVSVDFTKKVDGGHKRGVLTANGKPSYVELDNLGTLTAARTDGLTVQRVWLGQGEGR